LYLTNPDIVIYCTTLNQEFVFIISNTFVDDVFSKSKIERFI